MAHPPHTLKLGKFEISILSDGDLTVPTRLLARNVTDAEIKSTIDVSTYTVAQLQLGKSCCHPPHEAARPVELRPFGQKRSERLR
jgi:hypothetical protein